MQVFTAVVEKCPETGLSVGFVPGFPGAHTQGETFDELNKNLKEGACWLSSTQKKKIESVLSAPGWRQKKRDSDMKKMKNDPDMLEEYDFSGGVRGKYSKRYEEGTNVVVIDPDIAEYFPNHDSVNDALRSLTTIIKRQMKTQQGHRDGRS